MEIKESWDDDWPEEDWDEDNWDDDDVESYTVACPECGTDVYEDAEQCPACGNYIVHSSSAYVWQGRPVWWIVIGLLGIIAVIFALLPI